MTNKSNQNKKSYAAKAGGRFLALLLACVLIFSLSACGGKKQQAEQRKVSSRLTKISD